MVSPTFRFTYPTLLEMIVRVITSSTKLYVRKQRNGTIRKLLPKAISEIDHPYSNKTDFNSGMMRKQKTGFEGKSISRVRIFYFNPVEKTTKSIFIPNVWDFQIANEKKKHMSFRVVKKGCNILLYRKHHGRSQLRNRTFKVIHFSDSFEFNRQ